jgi:hypothetical protein
MTKNTAKNLTVQGLQKDTKIDIFGMQIYVPSGNPGHYSSLQREKVSANMKN